MIEVRDVSKVYGKKQNLFVALKGVSFTVPDGATVAIVGKSGSGKSTLMHVMAGLDRATDGDVTVDGKNLQEMKTKEIDTFRGGDMSFIFQAFFIEPNQTCYQNVALPLEITKTPFSRRRPLIEQALRQVDLMDKINSRARDLSGGQKQRLAIARAIVNKPRIVFADEPTGNLDSSTGDKIIELLFGLNKKLGSTLCIVTHDDELAQKCDIQIILKDGEIASIKQSNKRKAVAR
jgi:putative ABC transport system ATP-binding protein